MDSGLLEENKQTRNESGAEDHTLDGISPSIGREKNIDFGPIMKNIGKTIEDLRFEQNALLSQCQMYFNAIILVIGFTIALSSYFITRGDMIDLSDTSTLGCLILIFFSVMYGMIYCLYNTYWKSKVNPYIMYTKQKKEMTEDQREFNRFRGIFMAVSQLGAEKQSTSATFEICTLYFVIGFPLLVLNSLVSIHPILVLLAMLIIPAVPFIQGALAKRSLKFVLDGNREDFYNAIKNLFFEETFEDFEEAAVFFIYFSKKKKYVKKNNLYLRALKKVRET